MDAVALVLDEEAAREVDLDLLRAGALGAAAFFAAGAASEADLLRLRLLLAAEVEVLRDEVAARPRRAAGAGSGTAAASAASALGVPGLGSASWVGVLAGRAGDFRPLGVEGAAADAAGNHGMRRDVLLWYSL